MFVALRLIHLPDTREAEALVRELRTCALELPGLQTCWIAPVSAHAVMNAGKIVWRMTFASEAEAIAVTDTAHWRARIGPMLTDLPVTSLGYRLVSPVVRQTGLGIWRALIFRVVPHTPPDWVRALEEALPLLPAHVAEIRSWALSHIAYVDGPKAYTHVWEQEFDRVEDLTGPYMTDPAHWGIADAFFDAEDPRHCVDPHLVQVIGDIDDSILAGCPA